MSLRRNKGSISKAGNTALRTLHYMYKRIVVKVGTKVLSKDDGTLDERVLRHLAEQISLLKRKNVEIILVTKEDFRDRGHYLNMKNCLAGLLYDKVIPIVNENDVVAIAELVFTDNDELTGFIALQLKADAVIILSSVAGVLDGSSRVIPKITGKTISSFKKHVTAAKTDGGRGGMVSKFEIGRA